MLWGGMVVSELGEAGEVAVGDTEATGPGGVGVGSVANLLCDPGRTIASESWMLGLVLESGLFVSANACTCTCQQKGA